VGKPTKAPCGNGTGYQQTSILKTVLPNHVRWNIQPLLSCATVHGRNFVVKCGGAVWCETNIAIGSMRKLRFIYTVSQSYFQRCFEGNTNHALSLQMIYILIYLTLSLDTVL